MVKRTPDHTISKLCLLSIRVQSESDLGAGAFAAAG